MNVYWESAGQADRRVRLTGQDELPRIVIELTPDEARKLAFQIDSCDCYWVRGGIKELSDLETFITVMLTDPKEG